MQPLHLTIHCARQPEVAHLNEVDQLVVVATARGLNPVRRAD